MLFPSHRFPNHAELYHAEALRILSDLPAEYADCVICDPPYSSGGFTRGDRTQSTTSKYVQTGVQTHRPDFGGDSRDGRGWSHWCALWLAECHRITKPSGLCLMFSDWRQLPSATDALQAGGYVWRGIISWDKTEGARAPHTGYFRHQCEYIVWGSRGVTRKACWGGPWPGALRCSVRQSDKHHLTGKPTPLMRELVQCCPPAGLIVDPFMGSGTTGVAAVECGRRFVGIERDEVIYETALERIRAAKFFEQGLGAVSTTRTPEASL